jgi:hypothetical protein
MNAICLGCKAIHRNVPVEVVMVHRQNKIVLRCPRCNDKVIVFETDDDLFNIRFDIEGHTYCIMAIELRGSVGELVFVEVEV